MSVRHGARARRAIGADPVLPAVRFLRGHSLPIGGTVEEQPRRARDAGGECTRCHYLPMAADARRIDPPATPMRAEIAELVANELHRKVIRGQLPVGETSPNELTLEPGAVRMLAETRRHRHHVAPGGAEDQTALLEQPDGYTTASPSMLEARAPTVATRQTTTRYDDSSTTR